MLKMSPAQGSLRRRELVPLVLKIQFFMAPSSVRLHGVGFRDLEFEDYDETGRIEHVQDCLLSYPKPKSL